MASARPERLHVLFLGDNGHHQPTRRAKEILPVLAQNGIDLFYTDEREDLNDTELDRYDVVMLYNNHMTVSDEQIASLLKFVEDGGGLVVLHCASASFQNSEEFIRLVGAAFKSHGTGTFSAVRVAGSVLSESPLAFVEVVYNGRPALTFMPQNGNRQPRGIGPR